MKIAVTGGAGMIGSNLCAALLKAGHEVVVLDNFWRGSRDNLVHSGAAQYGERLRLVIADLSSFGDWCRELEGVDCVYHLADIVAGIGYVFSNEGFIFRKNLLINANVTAAVETMHVPRYVYVGTACSFPLELQTGVDAAPLREEDQYPANPESAYGWSKLMGELDAKYLAKAGTTETVVLVLHNVYGTPCEFESNRAQVLPALCHRALKAVSQGERELSVWGDGTQGRAFVHVDDVVSALITALTQGHGVGPIQIGPDRCTQIGEAAEIITRLAGGGLKVVFDPTKPTGDKGRCADYSKATRHLSWRPSVHFEQGLATMIEWIRTRQSA
jgi:GDP-D-mannose 3',5'-epimerase